MDYVVTTRGKPDRFEDRVSVGDTVEYNLDFAPWLEDKGTIVTTEWLVESGSAGIVDTDQSALLTFSYESRNVISCRVTTTTGESKKVWLIVKATEPVEGSADYA